MSALFPWYKEKALDSGHADNVDLNTDTIKVLLVDGYTFDSTDKYVSDITAAPGATIVARSGALTSPTVTSGTFDAADITVAAVPTGHTITDVIVYNDTGVDASSPVIAHIDVDQLGVALSLPTNGSDVLIQFHASGIFDL